MAAGVGGEGSSEGVGSTATSFEEFEQTVFREPESGIYIVNGDEPIDDIKKLYEYYEEHVVAGALIVHRSGGADARWNDVDKLHLTYCVSKSFGGRYDGVVQAMAEATGAWEQAANVDFVHLSAQDSSCTSSNGSVVFDVNPVDVGGHYLARASFPGQSRWSRNVNIDNSAFYQTSLPTLTGVLRHELGHALGFRHEHTRPEAGDCYEDDSWRALTGYDADSVMHYPHCNGTGDWSFGLTDDDVAGVQALYGAPQKDGPGGGGADDGDSESTSFAGSVAKGQSEHLAVLEVAPGSTFTVVMTGSGDPDLYVRFDAEPSLQAFDCRPYVSGAGESCSLSVPAEARTAQLMVHGYTAGSFEVSVTYVPGGPGGGPTEVHQSETGSLAQGQQQVFGPYPVVPGSAFVAAMSGSGDPDLYVRFGGPASTEDYDCRPYTAGADETCTLDVGTNHSDAYLMVRGYTATTYRVELTSTKP